MIERGRVTVADSSGYIVESLDRAGMLSPPLIPVNEEATYTVGDTVFFFLFPDGTGRILCGV